MTMKTKIIVKIGKKYCCCNSGRHDLQNHCVISGVKRGGNFYMDFPFNKPHPTYDTGEWERSDIHKIKHWGKKLKQASK